MLLILCGLPFSGKSVLASKIVARFDFVRIDLDAIKFDLFGQGVKDEDISPPQWDRVYQQMYQEIEDNLKLNKNVIHDTGNFTLSERQIIINIAQKLTIPTLTIFVDTPLETIRQRIAHNRQKPQRFDVSDQNLESCRAEMEPPTSENHIVYHPGLSDEDFFGQLKSRLNLL